MRTGALVESVQPHDGGITSVCLSPGTHPLQLSPLQIPGCSFNRVGLWPQMVVRYYLTRGTVLSSCWTSGPTSNRSEASRALTYKPALFTLSHLRPFHRSEKYRNNCDWNRACFTGGGKYIIAGSATGAINVWATASGKLESGTLPLTSLFCSVPPLNVYLTGVASARTAETDDNHRTMVSCCCWSLSTNQLLVAYRGESTDMAVWN